MPGRRLTLAERAQIEVLFGAGRSFPQIAEAIGRDRSTVWREVKRNNSYRCSNVAGGGGVRHPGRATTARPGGLGGLYRWTYSHVAAQRKAEARGRRHRPGKLVGNSRNRGHARTDGPLWPQVRELLAQRWSPQQIAAHLRAAHPDRPELQVSHETIYQAIYYQARGRMRAELDRQVALRSGRTRRRPQSRPARAERSAKPWIGDLHISARPVQAADRAVPGHWEGDLVIGARGTSAIITLVERTTRLVMLGALPHSRVSEQVTGVLTTLMRRLPAELAATLTWDQGSEMAEHADFTLATGCRVYFCDPHSPWQRGSNENTNGLLRQYFPRSTTDFRTYTQHDLDEVARQLNGRPRQTLDWKTPAQALNEYLVATAA
ncbi:IS30 family transposase [Spirillospora sp. NPDC048819]|uniref:IS30 family transposase n=1 Tax=Spirillospora sp. NPDC048819 TaxID=3155268 RepID=UPI0034039DCD